MFIIYQITQFLSPALPLAYAYKWASRKVSLLTTVNLIKFFPSRKMNKHFWEKVVIGADQPVPLNGMSAHAEINSESNYAIKGEHMGSPLQI